MLATDKASVREKLTQITQELDQKLTQIILKGDTPHLHKVLDEYRLECTNSELEMFKLIHQAAFEQGIKVGARTTLQEWSTSLVRALSESET